MSRLSNNRILLFILSILLCTSYISNTVGALTFSERGFAEQGITLYSPEGYDVCSSQTAGDIIGGETLPSQTIAYLESIKFTENINKNKESYQQAESQSGVPWQILAALHYRIAQLDPTISTLTGTPLGSVANNEGLTPGKDFVSDLTLAATQFKTLALSVYNVTVSNTKSLTTEQLGQAFLAYNAGLLYRNSGKTYVESPFVVNGLDEKHLGMSWVINIDILSGKDSLQVGALTVFQYLGGAFANTTTARACSGVSVGSAISTATGLAHPYAVANGKKNPVDAKPEYLKIWTEYGKKTLISDCGGFVSIVIRSSNIDIKFPVSGTDTILSYLSSNPKYIKVDYNSLQPGDILLSDNGKSRENGYSGHIMIYLGPTKGSDGIQYVAVDASLNQRVPGLRLNSSVLWMQNQAHSSAWRYTGE